MHSQETYELIERYLAGECAKAEAAELEAQAAADPALKALIELHREMESTFTDQKTMDFSAALAQVDADYHAEEVEEKPTTEKNTTAPKAKSKPFNWQVWGIAASIAILVGFGSIYFLNRGGNASPEALFGEYFSPTLAPSAFRSDEDVLEKRYQAAFDAYNEKAYAEAATAFEGIYTSSTNQKTAEFYAAVSFLAADQGDRAIPIFEGFVSTTNSYTTQSQWYLALAWLQKAAPDKAKPYLVTVAAKPGKYQADAKAILEKLD